MDASIAAVALSVVAVVVAVASAAMGHMQHQAQRDREARVFRDWESWSALERQHWHQQRGQLQSVAEEMFSDRIKLADSRLDEAGAMVARVQGAITRLKEKMPQEAAQILAGPGAEMRTKPLPTPEELGIDPSEAVDAMRRNGSGN